MPQADNFEKKYGIPKSATRAKRATTINDLLARDDINGILSDLNKEKPSMTDLIVIYVDKEGLKWQYTDDTLVSKAVWMIECMKFDLLNEGE